jgi:hypothetical protein
MKKEVGSRVGSGFISQRYGSGDPDPIRGMDPGIRIPLKMLRIPNTDKHIPVSLRMKRFVKTIPYQ